MFNDKRSDKASDEAANLLLRIGVAVAFIATPAFQLLSQRAIFILPPIGGALILSAGLVLAPRLNMRDIFAFLLSRAGLAACFLAFWMVLSLLWTPFPSDAAPRLAKALLTLLCVLPVSASLPARTRAANLYFLPLGAALTAFAALILGTRLFSGESSPHADVNLVIGMEAALLLLWPALAATHLRNRATLSASLAIVVLAAAVSVPTTGALVATACAAAAFALGLWNARLAGLWIGRLGAACILFAPLFPLLIGPLVPPDAPIWLHSVKVWNGMIANDGARILAGHGFNFIFSGHMRGYLPANVPSSMLFEVWTDLGLVGAVATAALVAFACEAAAAQSERVAPFWLGAITYVYAMGAFGLANTQAWWITVLAVALGAFAFVARGDYKTARPTAPKWAG